MGNPSRFVVLCAAATLLATRPRDASAQDTRAMAVLEGASARYSASRTLCADFSQTLSVPLLGQETSGRGRMCQEQPNLFAMRFTEPAGDVVVVDGTSMWIHFRSLDPLQVIKLSLTNAPGGFDFHREFLDRPAAKYVIAYEAIERIGGRDTHRIRLAPRASASYEAALVWIDTADHLLRQVRVEEESGSIRTVTLDRIEPGANVPADYFKFTPPPGARVLAR
jgi:outer membrane lipoprotein carrier protein